MRGHLPLERVVFTEEEIAERVRQVGEEIDRDYRLESGADAEVVLVTILKGAFVFLADLVRCLHLRVEVDFLAVSGYGVSHGTSSGVRIVKDLSMSIRGRDVLVVEDIVDTGLTLNYILRNLKARGPKSVRICTFLDRAVRRIVPLHIDYRCFEVGEEFVVGYGLDYMQKWRNLPFVCTLEGTGLGS